MAAILPYPGYEIPVSKPELEPGAPAPSIELSTTTIFVICASIVVAIATIAVAFVCLRRRARAAVQQQARAVPVPRYQNYMVDRTTDINYIDAEDRMPNHPERFKAATRTVVKPLPRLPPMTMAPEDLVRHPHQVA
ncbi:hypothetical protein QR680_013854 [Steinernema hermaphroditum]|uniref:Uncharacterized protein n=1 Tax=Steinernema hermaphroditum TaxID=289476 RepID=A0AA39M326_9BILA|nr:hypothetical protein QR680_013854 [Steinernema hermaphroditum]